MGGCGCYVGVGILAKVLDIIGCCLMIALAIAKFCNAVNYIQLPIEHLVSAYMILMGIMFIIIEIPVQCLAKYFLFLSKLFGKAFFCLYLGFWCFDHRYWFTIVVGVYWWAIALVFFIIAFFFLAQEKDLSGNSTLKVEVKDTKK